MADELSDEERELLEKHRASKRAEAEQDREVWIKRGDDEASVPYSKARSWLQKAFGIDLDAEPVQEPEPAAKPKAAKPAAAGDGTVTRFGRRVS